MGRKSREFTEREIRFVSDNLNISPASLGRFLNASKYQVEKLKTKILNGGKAKVEFNCGFSYLAFHALDDCCSFKVFRSIKGKLNHIGQSTNLEKAVEILDKHLFEVEQGFIKL
tara:strand:- start:423 stop:764 length:342 start_codon:yes stop_codon:yes gene_type:complete